jgi:hypothetical protein
MVVQREVLEERRKVINKRRRIIWLIVLGALCLFIALFSVFQYTDVIFGIAENMQSVPQSGDWAMFRRNPAHTGAIDPTAAPLTGELKWSFTTGAAIHSSPAVNDGIVYFGSQDRKLGRIFADYR